MDQPNNQTEEELQRLREQLKLRTSDGNAFVNNFLLFKGFITPTFISIIYWILLVVNLISGIGLIGSSFGYYGFSFLAFFSGLLTIILGTILIRVFCELIVVSFRKHDLLKQIAENTKK